MDATGIVGRLILGKIGWPGCVTWILELEPAVDGWGRGLFVFLGFCVRGLGRLVMGIGVPELHPPVAGAEVFGLTFIGVYVGLTTGTGVGATITAALSEVHPPVAGGAVILTAGLTTTAGVGAGVGAGAGLTMGLTMGFTIFMGGTSSVGPLLHPWVPELYLDLSSGTGSFSLG
jgi:hypothetical protein